MPALTIEQAYRLAVQLIQTGRVQQARSLYEQILRSPPPHAEGLVLLSALAFQLGDTRASDELISRAVLLNPAVSDHPVRDAIALSAAGRTEDAIAAYRVAVAARPDRAEAHQGLAILLHQLGRIGEAIASYRAALALHPDSAETLSNLGNALKQEGAFDESLAVLQRAVSLRPDFADAYNNLGNTLEQLKRPHEALAAFRRAVELRPDLAEAHNNLGNALHRAGDFAAAVASYRTALALNPNYPDALVNLANALKDTGELDEAITLYRKAVALNPASWHSSNLWLSLYYHPRLTPRQILAEHRAWAEPLEASVAAERRPHDNDPNPSRRLRVGYVSGDFRHHVVGYNLLPLFENHDRENFEIVCYSTVARADEITARFKAVAHGWRQVQNESDAQLARLIRDDRIDLLIDLSLHSGNNRLGVFARKPAPLQATFAGYPGTTGLSTIDYRLTDPFLDPPGETDSFYSEKSYRLADSFWCYQPLSPEPQVNPLPALSAGHVTFGSLGNFCKVNQDVLGLWSRVLLAVPRSSLLMMSHPGPHRDRTRGLLASLGVDPARVDFVDYQPRAEYLQGYHRIDVGLDTFPYNGHTTSLDSFWMGVPVVTPVGQWAVSRAGFSQLSNLGLPALAAQTPDQFVEIATGVAADIPKLAHLRGTLRRRMESSPLMNAFRFARNIETAFRDIWAQYCRSRVP